MGDLLFPPAGVTPVLPPHSGEGRHPRELREGSCPITGQKAFCCSLQEAVFL